MHVLTFEIIAYKDPNTLQALDINGGICNLKTYMIIYSVKLNANDPFKDYVHGFFVLPHKKRYMIFQKI